MIFAHRHKRKGFTLIELVITIAVLSLGVIGVYSAFNPIIATTYNLSSRLQAAYLAEEGVEIVRNIRDGNMIAAAKNPRIPWDFGLTSCSLGCQLDCRTGTAGEVFADQLKIYDDEKPLLVDGNGFYGYGQGKPTKFRRKVTITQDDGPESMKVLVQVFWDYNGGERSFQTSQYLYNYR